MSSKCEDLSSIPRALFKTAKPNNQTKRPNNESHLAYKHQGDRGRQMSKTPQPASLTCSASSKLVGDPVSNKTLKASKE